MHAVSIVGCGYTGLRLARRYRAALTPVRGFATRADSLRAIAAAGAEAVRLDLDERMSALDFTGDVLFYCAPPAPQGSRDLRLDALLAHLAGVPRRIVYLSTTGVYGDHGGGAVDEDTAPTPRTARAVRRLAAETALRAWAVEHAVSWCILRVPGIYGPGRLPLERLRRGEPALEHSAAMPGNRIHVEDLVTACMAAGATDHADRIYNVTDGTDDSLTAYLERVARIALLPPPPLIGLAEARATFSASTWSFLDESRRVDNRRMRVELGVTPAFSDLDAGIRASLDPAA